MPYLSDVLPHTYNCKGMEGRYLNIVIPGKEEQLTLCEVEVTGQPSDSSTLPGDLNLIFSYISYSNAMQFLYFKIIFIYYILESFLQFIDL